MKIRHFDLLDEKTRVGGTVLSTTRDRNASLTITFLDTLKGTLVWQELSRASKAVTIV